MPIVSDGKGVWENPEDAAAQLYDQKISPSFWETVGTQGQQAFEKEVEPAEEAQYSDTFGARMWRNMLAGWSSNVSEGVGPGAAVTPDDIYQPSPTISADQANERYSPPGTKLFDQPVPDKLAQQIGKYHSDMEQASSDIARFEQNHGTVTNFSKDIVAGFLDPIQDSALFVPGIGEEAVASRLGLDVAESVGARWAARGISGASIGAAQGGAVAASKYALEDDYSIRDALRDTLVSGAMGTIGTLGLGAVNDIFQYAAGGHINDVPAEARPVAEEVAPVISADAQTQNAASRTSVAQIVSGRPVDVADFFPRMPPATETAIGRFMDHPSMPQDVTAGLDQFDREAVVRDLEPNLFSRYDDLANRRSTLANWYSDLSNQRTEGFAEEARQAQALGDELDDLQDRLPRARQKPLQRQIAARIAEIQNTQAAGPPSVVKPSPGDLAQVQQQMQQTDYAMRDMAPQVSDAYRRADEMIARAQLAQQGERLAALEARQQPYLRPGLVQPDMTSMLDREMRWRQSGIAPGISYEDLATARSEVDAASKAAAAESPPTEPKAPDGWAKPHVDATAEELVSTTGEPTPATEPVKRPPAEAATGKPATLQIDTTNWLPEERAELEAANADVEKAAAYEAACQEAAGCLLAAGG